MDYIKHFIKEEDAVEAMEWMAIVAVAAVLITIAAKCGAAIKSKVIAIAQSIRSLFFSQAVF